MNRFLIPLAAFAVMVGLLYAGLGLNPREVPSPFIGKAAPAFDLAQLQKTDARFSQNDLAGQVWLLNVWASWCVACREEHPVLVDFAKTKTVPIIGLNYKDRSPDALRWLDRWGDPYTLSVVDADGRVGIDYGVYGVPETFVIDRTGVIRYKQIGPITPEVLAQKILPLVKDLQK